ncbi:MAG: hypothetical protein AAF390_15545, partial [Pseudomonadota bacterium]
DDGTGVFNLVFIADCEGQLVTAAKAVALDHPSFFDGRMDIDAQQLTNVYYRSNGTEENPLPGYDRNTTPDYLRAGQFFTIHDIDTYYLWQSAVEEYLRASKSIVDLLDQIEDPARDEMLVDFFTHLLMAALFRYDIPYEIRTAGED